MSSKQFEIKLLDLVSTKTLFQSIFDEVDRGFKQIFKNDQELLIRFIKSSEAHHFWYFLILSNIKYGVRSFEERILLKMQTLVDSRKCKKDYQVSSFMIQFMMVSRF